LIGFRFFVVFSFLMNRLVAELLPSEEI